MNNWVQTIDLKMEGRKIFVYHLKIERIIINLNYAFLPTLNNLVSITIISILRSTKTCY